MNFSMFRSFHGKINCLIKRIVAPKTLKLSDNQVTHHQICRQYLSTLTTTSFQNIFKPASFLAPILPQFNQICGLKVKGQLHLRCKGCYFVSRQGKLYVMCHLKPRHKQVQMQTKFRYRRHLTFAHQKKVREW